MQDSLPADAGEILAVRAYGRSLSDFRLDGSASPNGLLPAEERLLTAAVRGEPCIIAASRPEAATAANRVRPGLLRFLLLGGDSSAPVHERGVQLHGAVIEGSIDLEGCTGIRTFSLRKCLIEGQLIGRNAEFGELNLAESYIRGIDCGFASFKGSVTLDNGFLSDGEVRFSAAEIKGRLYCRGGHFHNPGGMALTCNGTRITGSAFLRDGFTADGQVRMHGAWVGGNLWFAGGRFRYTRRTRWEPADRRGHAAAALSLAGATIRGELWLIPEGAPDGGAAIEGSLDLQGARAGSFIDDPRCWPAASVTDPEHGELTCVILLDGFSFERFAFGAPTDSETRARWLLRQRPSHFGASFRAQPFEQLIKVLRAMGHDEDARRIAMLKQSLLLPVRVRHAAWWRKPFVWLIGRLWGYSCGYGYRPHRLIVALLALWLSCAGIYQYAAANGAFVPADAQVWTTTEIAADCQANWTRCDKVTKLMVFDPLMYSADVLLPVIDFKQRSTWVPAPAAVRWVSWVENFLGSLGVLLLGAILGGLVKKD
jgi:hypothetical protein